MQRTSREIAAYVGGELHGDASTVLSSVASLKNAGPADLSYAEDKFRDPAIASGAGCIVVGSGDFPGKTVIVTKHPKAAFARAALWLLAGPPRESGIHPTAVIAADATIGEHVKIGAGAVIEHGVRIGEWTTIEAGCYIGEKSRLGSHCLLYPHVVIYRDVDIANHVIVHAGAVIGADGFGFVKDGDRYIKFPQVGSVIIEDDVEIGANTCIDRGSLETTIIRRGVKLDNLVQVAHNVIIGEDTAIAAQTGIAGGSRIGARVLIAGQVGIAERVRLDDGTAIGAQAGIPNDKHIRSAGIVYWGTPARPIKDHLEQQAALTRLPALLREIAGLKAKVEQE